MKQRIGAGRMDDLFRFVRSRGFVLAGVGLASIYWLAEGATHAFLLHEGSFLHALSPRDPDELWTRPLVGFLFLVLGSSVQWLMARRRRAERMLRQQAYELGERIKELNCLYTISKLVESPGVSLPGILQGTAEAVAASW